MCVLILSLNRLSRRLVPSALVSRSDAGQVQKGNTPVDQALFGGEVNPNDLQLVCLRDLQNGNTEKGVIDKSVCPDKWLATGIQARWV